MVVGRQREEEAVRQFTAGSAQHGAMLDSVLIGRSAEVRQLRTLIGAGGADARSVVLLGEAGLGKTALLSDLGRYACAHGWRVLAVAGLERESGLALAGLLRLLRPAWPELPAGPGRPVDELRAGLDRSASAAAAGASLAGSAVLELLTGFSGAGDGMLVLVDDAQWMDTASLAALAFAADRLIAENVALLFAARGDTPPAVLLGIQEQRLGPLSGTDAGELLAAQRHPPRGRIRAQLLAQAAGNPLALIELSEAVAADPAAHPPGMPLPLTARLGAMFAARLDRLPAHTSRALLLMAVADDADLTAVTRAGPSLDPAAFGRAEELGLITADAAGARFRHPLIRSAVYHAAPFAVRAEVHREVADLLRDQPDRQAWHLAAASFGPDEDVAARLAATASQAQRRGRATGTAAALERAADLSPRSAERAERQVAAAEAALLAGQTDWALDLAARALQLTGRADLRARSGLVTGQALAWSGRFSAAVDALLPLARQAARQDPAIGWNALALAAMSAFQAGVPERVGQVRRALAELPPPDGGESQAAQAWTLAAIGQTRAAETLLERIPNTVITENRLCYAGCAAWLLGQTSKAIELLSAAQDGQSDPGARAISGGSLAALGWAYLDAGRWDEALRLAAEARDAAETDISRSAHYVITATIEAARGESADARALIATALATRPGPSRLIAARAQHALGLCALSDGDYPTAFRLLRGLFSDDGVALHDHASHLAVADLALAAARSGHRLEGREILKRIAVADGQPDSRRSPRLGQLSARAKGILADPATVGGYAADALDDQAGAQWPFERAQLQLEFGQWLRRRRRINEARPVLSAALEAFLALGARPWEERARTELRASGVAVPGALADPSRLREVTPQQLEILRLAAQGLSNREIAQRLFLSPRTVASHLYRSFPKLGVAGRNQLHLLFPQPQVPG